MASGLCEIFLAVLTLTSLELLLDYLREEGALSNCVNISGMNFLGDFLGSLGRGV